MAFMPEHAPLILLIFLGTVGVVGLAVIVSVLSIFLKKKWIALGATATAILTGTLYALVLAAVSLTSHQVVLPPGNWKYFCEIDCHIAYSVAGVQTAAALGPELQQTSAHGKFVVVRLKTWFDEHSISPHRGDAPLVSGERQVLLVDDAGRIYAPSPEGAAALSRGEGAPARFSQPLRPGEFFTTSLVFDVPKDARELRLFVTDREEDWLTRLIIDHENSFLHKKIYLGLDQASVLHSSKALP
jgi:hypothetical protein